MVALCLSATSARAASVFGASLPYSSFQNATLPYDANTVLSFEEDDNGLMWIGTNHGLFSYNGFDSHRINNKATQAIAKTDHYHLYLGTDDGLLLFNMLTESFEALPEDLEAVGAIRSLLFHDGTLWIGTRDRGLFSYNLRSGILEKHTITGWNETFIFALVRSENGFYVGAREGLSFLDIRTMKRNRIGDARDIFSLDYDNMRHLVYVGTENGLMRYDQNTGQLTTIIESLCVNAIARDIRGQILVGTDNGLYVCDRTFKDIRHVVHDSGNSQSLGNNVIWELRTDRFGNVWLGTDRGFAIARPQASTQVIKLSDLTQTRTGNMIGSVLRDKHGDYWLGGDNGIIRIANGSITWFSMENQDHPLRNNRIRSIFEDHEGDIWIATDASIAHHDRATNQFTFFNLHDTNDRNANWSYEIEEDSHGRLWVSSFNGGLYVVDRQALLNSGGTYTMTEDYFGANDSIVHTAYNFQNDGDGHLWLNCGGWLAVVDMKTMEVERREAWLDNMLYVDGVLWYTENGMLKRHFIEKRETERLSFTNPTGLIFTLVRENGNIWFSTSTGIYAIEAETGIIRRTLVANRDYRAAYYDRTEDEIIWGGEDCLMRLNLKQSKSDRQAAAPLLTGISINGEHALTADGKAPQYGRTIRLTASQNVVFELSRLDYAAGDATCFYYQLGGDNWHAVPVGDNRLSFASLPYGSTTLKLSLTNPEMDNMADVVSYSLHVPYPWFLRWPMVVGYVIVCAAAIFFFARTTQRKAKQKYQQREKERSMELSRQKMDFFVNMSHELKTPLSLVIAPLGVLMSETTNAKMRERLKPIQENALKLSDLINRIVDFKRMEYESEDALIRSRVEVCSLMKNCVKSFATAQEERHIAINFKANAEQAWINADMMKMESIFMNLLSNAVKYVSDNTGEVNIQVDTQKEKMTITVADNGPGVPDEELPMLTIRFYQGRNANKVGGTGVGLYLVKKFTELHGGTVAIKSHNGLTVSIELPLTNDNQIEDLPTEQQPTAQAEDEKKATILIVDDNLEITDFLTQALSTDYVCMTAHNGKEGLEQIKMCEPDLMIVDEMMPVMDGMEFCKHVRRLTQTSVTPIIMLTAKSDETTEIDSIKVGVDVFMPKPFDMKKLSLQIIQLLTKRKRMETAVNIQNIANPTFDAEPATTPTGDEALLELVTNIIEENMADESFNVATLCDMAHIDQKQLYRRLTQMTGLTTIAYIKKLRMKKAAVLLSEKRFTIQEVMYMVGYSNASYFTKCFVAEYGVTPKEYGKG